MNKISSPSSRPQHACAHCHSRRGLLATVLTFAAAPPLQPRPCAAGPPAGYVPLDTVDATKVAFNAVEQTFSQEFAALLSRFLVKNEASAARWWDQKQKEARTFEAAKSTVVDSPFRRLAEEREEYYLENAFSRSSPLWRLAWSGLRTAPRGRRALGRCCSSAIAAPRPVPAQKRSLAQLLSLIENPVQPTRHDTCAAWRGGRCARRVARAVDGPLRPAR